MIWMILLACLVVLTYLIGLYNSIVQKNIACDNAWSQIDVQLKRRHDLIPNLVETVKGYASHEQETLQKVIQARQAAINSSTSQEVVQNENMLTGALKQLFALSESYPDLKANQNFLALQEEITSTENRIGFARQHYNDSVGGYNTAIQQFPGSFVASFGTFPPRTFFELSSEEKQTLQSPPTVKF